MGLKPKKEMLHKYFLYSQAALIMFMGISAMHGVLDRNTLEEQSAREEIPKIQIFDLLHQNFNEWAHNILDRIFK